MSGFKIINNSEKDYFARQRLINGWDQEKLRDSRVLVIGAGATGNETLKNLALLGIGNILVCDMDDISSSNLSRTVLFRKDDAGKQKAETAALRVKEMTLEDTCSVDYFDGDVVWELGAGVYRYFDVVLGCLDNVETRFAINKASRYVGKPWVDAGIYALAGSIKVFDGSGVCYQCFSSEEQLKAARKRYSCDDFKKRMFSEQKMPTVQIASAIVSALQVQEAIKIIMGSNALYGKKIFFQGTTGEFELINMPEEETCYAHASYGEITELPLTNAATVSEFLSLVSQPQHSGEGAAIDMRGDRSFLHSVRCSKCGEQTVFNKPSFRLYKDDVKCGQCQATDDNNLFKQGNVKYIDEFDLTSDGTFLGMTLNDIGIPKLHIISVRDKDGDYKYYELSGDLERVMPTISQKMQKN